MRIPSKEPKVSSFANNRSESAAQALVNGTATLTAAHAPGIFERIADNALARAQAQAAIDGQLAATGAALVAVPMVFASMAETILTGAKGTSTISAKELKGLEDQFNQANPYAKAHLAALASSWLTTFLATQTFEPDARDLLERMVQDTKDPTLITESERNEASSAVALFELALMSFADRTEKSLENVRWFKAGPFDENVTLFTKDLSAEERSHVKQTVLDALVDGDGNPRFKVAEQRRAELEKALDALS